MKNWFNGLSKGAKIGIVLILVLVVLAASGLLGQGQWPVP